MIHFENQTGRELLLDIALLNRWLRKVIARQGRIAGPVNYQFCTDQKILEVNREFLDHHYYTDIITFDYGQDNRISGDIFISLDTVESNALEQGVDFQEELRRIIVHGILHLCGQNDKEPEDKELMTQKENDSLSIFPHRE